MKQLIILESSLNPKSKSKVLAQAAKQTLEANHQDLEVKLLNIGDYKLPICDGSTVYSDPNVQKLGKELQSASAILIATPIYNYTINSNLKNAIECTGRDAWSDKVVGFLVAAGGQGSYMAIMGIANSLMLDFRCLIVPRFVYALSQDVENGAVVSDDVRERIKQLTEKTVQLAQL